MGAPIKVEARFHRHPKIQDLFEALGKDTAYKALGLWLIVGTRSADDELDGDVPDRYLKTKRERGLADALVRAKLWERVKGGYLIHDFLDYNLSKAQLQQWRVSNRTRQASWRDKQRNNGVTNSGVTTGSVVIPSSEDVSAGVEVDPTEVRRREIEDMMQ